MTSNVEVRGLVHAPWAGREVVTVARTRCNEWVWVMGPSTLTPYPEGKMVEDPVDCMACVAIGDDPP